MTRRGLVRAAVCVVAAGVLLAGIRVLFGYPHPMLRIEWRNIGDEERAALERQWTLIDLNRQNGASRFYALGDTSDSTLRAIVTNPSVADTDGIDRGPMRVPSNVTLTDRVGGLVSGVPQWLPDAVTLLAWLLVLVAIVLATNLTSRGSPSTIATAGMAAAMFLATLAWRFLTFTGFSNDHYVHVALAQQVLMGDRPVRDFIDQGWPLMYLLSAAGWQLTGGTLGAEWMIASIAFAVGAACTVMVGARLSRSLVIAILVAVVEVLILPRSYSYPKIAAYAVAAWGMLALADRPSRGRIVAMAAIIAIAFLLRHDHGLFVGVGAAVCIAIASRSDGWRAASGRVATLAGFTLLFLVPWAIFVSANGGLLAYFQGGLEFSRGERDATSLRTLPALSLFNPLESSERAAAWLFWLFWLLPVACGARAVIGAVRGKEWWRGETALVAGIAITAMLVNATFLRQALEVRVPDAIVPAVLLAAYALGRVWAMPWRRPRLQQAMRLVSLVVLTVSVGAVARISDVRGQYANASIGGGLGSVRGHIAQVTRLLGSSHRDNLAPPSRYAAALTPFFGYLDRCSAVADRLIVTDQYPEVLVIAGRKFAGDGVVLGSWFTSAAHQDRTLRQLHATPALFVLEMGDVERFRQGFPLLADYVQNDYEPLTTVPVEGTSPIDIRVMRNRSAARRDADTGWPCFR